MPLRPIICFVPSLCLRLVLGLAVALLAAPAAQAVLDDNTNGMSDVFEAAYGPGLLPDQDPDGDGRNNRLESIAGTHPRDGASFADIERLTFPSNQVVRLEWFAAAGKCCRIQVSTNLQTWTNIGPSLMATGGMLSVDLPLAQTYPGGTVHILRWTGMDSNSWIETVKQYATSGVPPSVVLEQPNLDVPQTNPNIEHYGQAFRGWLIPPASGLYTFWIAGDDSSELWLSTNATTSGRRRIAWVDGWTDHQDWYKYSSQRSTQQLLTAFQPYFLEAYQKEWGGGDNLSVAWAGPGIGTGATVIAGRHLATTPASLAALGAARRLYFRVSFCDVDSDADGLGDYEERLIGFAADNATTTPRLSDLDNVRRMLGSPNIVTVGTGAPRAYESTAAPGMFTFFRSGNLNPLTVQYTVGGTAAPGADYAPLSGVVHFPVGSNSVSISVLPQPDALLEPGETVVVTVLSNTTHRAGSPAQATVTIDDAPDILFVANLRPDPAIRSGGSGTASLRMAGNEVFATAALSFGNLTTTQQLTQFYIAPAGSGGTNVLVLPAGQIPLRIWNFEPIAGLTSTQIVAALKNGNLWARVTSGAFPAGEIFGRFQPAVGWQTMPIPPAPPALPSGLPTTNETYRFLTQATFGPVSNDVAYVLAHGFSNWISAQLTNAPSLHLPLYQARRDEWLARSGNADNGWQGPRQEAWWQRTLTAPDQLRQRMAFALSEIFVVSQFGALDSEHEGTTRYYDMLLTNAFGNYRSLLEQVTLSPMMGVYLSMIRNQKPNAVTGSEPDENYAREVMQLFSIGLNRLHPDGSLLLDANGLPTPTYTQADIVGLAHVFTGWGPGYDPANPPGDLDSHFYWGWDSVRPMAFFANFHDTNSKHIVNGTFIPAGQSGPQDLQQALDALFHHPNTGPFIARQLIQRFVTSNPSPGYIYRVASVFNDNGSGVRGDLAAVIRAVLLDYEARSTGPLADQTFGKAREPVLRMSHLLRSFHAQPGLPGDPRYFLNLQWDLPQQAPLLSPSVFNFFQPGYTHPGPIASAGLVAPEFQITSETTVINQANLQHAAIHWDLWTSEPVPGTNYNVTVSLDVSPEVGLITSAPGTQAQKEAALLDHLNARVLNGQLSPGLRQAITNAFTSLPWWYGTNSDAQESRVRLALYLLYASPEFAIQR